MKHEPVMEQQKPIHACKNGCNFFLQFRSTSIVAFSIRIIKNNKAKEI